jgi:hypothetical protein
MHKMVDERGFKAADWECRELSSQRIFFKDNSTQFLEVVRSALQGI